MSETWKRLEGTIIAERFRLRECLAGSAAGAVFVADEGEGGSPKTAIKLIRVDAQETEGQLSRLNAAKGLHHPHLIQVLEVGRCEIGDTPFVYALMEYAEENLGQLLPHRTLTTQEARELVGPLLDVLGYLHSHGLVHGGIRPANILAIGNQVKLSGDGFYRNGEAGRPNWCGIYAPPEAATGVITPAADVWSLGVMLVEALTGDRPVLRGAEQEEPLIPATMPMPFHDLAGNCLRMNPEQRWTVTEIAARLQRPSETATAQEHPRPRRQLIPKSQTARPRLESRRYVLAAMIVSVGLAASLGGVGMLRQRSRAERGSSAPEPVAATGAQPQENANREPEVPKPSAGRASQPPQGAGNSARLAVPLSMREETRPNASGEAGIFHRVLPDVSPRALDTIQGTVRVHVRVNVDPSGNVADATFDSRGPSRYFADRAMQAARLWKFAPADAASQNAAREWALRFEYKRTGTTITPEQTKR